MNHVGSGVGGSATERSVSSTPAAQSTYFRWDTTRILSTQCPLCAFALRVTSWRRSNSVAFGRLCCKNSARRVKNDMVNADGSNTNAITLGNGAGDVVNADISGTSTITLGNGAGDVVNAEENAGDTITLGNGAGEW
jgi:hypothetical protein